MARYRFWAACLLLGTLCTPAVAAESIRVVNEGGIRDAWTLPPGYKLAIPVYPVAYAAQRAEVCVAVGYLINPDGSTSGFSLLKSWSSVDVPGKSSQDYWSAFAEAAAQALAQWHFQPRPEVGAPQPVYTVATMLFAPASADLRGRCAIPNLVVRLRELREDSRTRRKMDIALFDRLELGREAQREQSLTQQRMR